MLGRVMLHNHFREWIVIHASGTFDVTMTPEGEPQTSQGATLGVMTIDKTYRGDFTGKGIGRMLSAMTEVKGSAGYVAIERVTGTLHGRTGSFVLQHTGTMTRGEPHLVITIVPDSGAGELVGITGTKMIRIEEGKHFYDLDYELADA